MPHGGYHGRLRVNPGSRLTVNKGSSLNVGGGQQVVGGKSSLTSKGVQTSAPKRKQLKTSSEIPDNRERFIANQAQKAANQQAQFLMNQANRRSGVEAAMRYAPETVNKSDFTGYTGGLFGLRAGNFQDTGIPKLREGLSSEEYANYMRGLYSINPQRFETLFPFASGKTITDITRVLPGIGTLQNFAGAVKDKTGDVVQGLKEIAMNKGIIPRDNLNDMGTTASDPSSTDTLGINQDVDPNALQAPELAKFLSPQDMGFSSPLGRFVPNPQDMGITAQPGRFVQNPQDMNIQPKMSAKDYFDDLSEAEKEYVLGLRQDNPAGMLQTDPNMFTNPATGGPLVFAPTAYDRDQLRGNIPGIGRTTKMTRNMMEQLDPFTNPDVAFVPLKEGGLASINNPEYNMLMNASNFNL